MVRYFFKENPEAEYRVERLIERVKAELLDRFKEHVKSIIIIGSLAREEGTWKNIDGRLIIISDLDFLVLTDRPLKASGELREGFKRIEEEAEIHFDVDFCPVSKLSSFARKSFLLDAKEAGFICYGTREPLDLLDVSKDKLDFHESLLLFLIRVVWTVLKCSPRDFISRDAQSLQRLSYSASRMMFTCADFITINSGCYTSFSRERVKIVRGILSRTDLNIINKQEFLRDLDKAECFRFSETAVAYLDDGLAFWLRARDYLMNLFRFYFKQEYRTEDISRYLDWEGNGLSIKGRCLLFASRLKLGIRLLKSGKLLNLCTALNAPSNSRILALTLFLALGEKIDGHYLDEAYEYLAEIICRVKRSKGAENDWVNLRENLVILQEKMGVI